MYNLIGLTIAHLINIPNKVATAISDAAACPASIKIMP
jgi:hypothetical protein